MEVLNTTSPKRVPGETASPSNTEPSSSTRRPEDGEVFKSGALYGHPPGLFPRRPRQVIMGRFSCRRKNCMRHPRFPRLATLSLFALIVLVQITATALLAAAGYTIILKDGSSLIAKEKYTVQ